MNIDENIFNFDDEKMQEVKIRPDYYIHTALLMAQRSLMFSVAKSSVGEGLTAYSVFVEQIEVLCKAAGYIDEDYFEEIKSYKNTDEYKKQGRSDVQMSKLANKKLELLMKNVFKGSPLEFSLKLKGKNIDKGKQKKE